MNEPNLGHGESEHIFKPSIELSNLSNDAVSTENPVSEEKRLSNDELDELAFLDERVLGNIALLRSARDKGDLVKAADIVEIQKKLVEQIKIEIQEIRGEYEDPEAKLERLELERHARVSEISSNLKGDETEDHLLHAYELVGSDGQLTRTSIHSPLFHTYTKSAFSHYLSMVDKFNAMSEAESQLKFGLKGIGKANTDRTQAHDAVAKLVGRDLVMDFDVARRLVAKMRDEIFPGSGETRAYATAVRRGEKLADRYSGDVSRVVDEEMHYIHEALTEADRD